jgi:hypothetical protein
MKISLCSSLVALGVILGAGSPNLQAANPSAFDLIKLGDKYIGDQAKDRVVQIRSEKSVGGLTPDIWYVVYYDPTATLKAVEVKFGAGQMMTVKRPMRLLEPVTHGDQPLDNSKMKVDSDRALAVASKAPLLHTLNLRYTQMWLEQTDYGVTWKIRFWAAKLTNPNETADVGDIFVSADKGEIVQNNLHPNSVE